MTVTARAGMVGSPPTVLIQPVVSAPKIDSEQAKYEKMWAVDAYRDFAPGEGLAELFLRMARPSKNDTVIDFGAGTGRGALMIALMGGCKVKMLDFADNCLDDDVRNSLTTQSHVMSFQHQDLRQPIQTWAKYGFCTDVMEHIPTEDIDRVLHNILKSAQHIFFQISTLPDHFGKTIGEHLHLTVQPYEWWMAKLKEHDAVIQWSDHTDGACAFYVSAWQSPQELIKHGTLNSEQEVIRSNIKQALERNLQEVMPYEKNDIPVMILAGGPSMNDYAEEIVSRRKAGEKMITVNGAYNWALNRGINPSATIVVDSREFNKRFIEPSIPDCHYLLASQCHPSTFDSAPRNQTLLWHSAIDEDMLKYLESYYQGTGKVWYPVLGGSTVMLRALPLMVLLGYSKFEVFGFDSCLMDGKHHSYQQDENDHSTILQVVVNGRTFHCHPWMVSQAQEFLDLMQLMAEHIELVVHGDGLIAWLIQTASEMGDAKLEVVEEV